MKALTFDGTLRLQNDAPVPRRDGEALVRVICAGICNTDLEIAKGYAGFHGTLGHEFVGRVIEAPDRSLEGRRVVGEINAGCGQCESCIGGDSRHCAVRTVLGIKDRSGAFAEYLALPARNLIELPESIGDEDAVFVEPLAAAFNILDQITINTTTNVAVVGDGKLAQLIVLVLRQTGCRVTVFGRHRQKLELTRESCASCILIEDGDRDDSQHARFDVVIEASGSASGLATALKIVKPVGTVVLKSTHHGVTPLDTSQIVVNEITVMGSRCGRFGPAIELLASGKADVGRFITARMPLQDGLRAFKEAAEATSMKVILQMN